MLTLVAPDGTAIVMPVEAKTTLNARDVPAVLAQLEEIRGAADAPTALGPALVTSRYIAPRSRQMLTEAGVSYADATGNLRIAAERPALYLEGAGAKSDPWRGPERETRTLRGRPAARVVRALVDFRSPVGIRELANRSEASLGSTHRTVAFLDKEALLTRGPRGEVASVNWRDLLLRWSEDYNFQESNRVRAALEPRGLERLLSKLGELGEETTYAVTGALSAARIAEVAAPRLAAILTPDVDALLDRLNLADGGDAVNVLLAQPFDDVLLARSTVYEGVRYAAMSQTAVDLLTSPGRGPTEGQALLSWMTANEDRWRG